MLDKNSLHPRQHAACDLVMYSKLKQFILTNWFTKIKNIFHLFRFFNINPSTSVIRHH